MLTTKHMPILIKPTDFNWLVFTGDYPRSQELEKHLDYFLFSENILNLYSACLSLSQVNIGLCKLIFVII